MHVRLSDFVPSGYTVEYQGRTYGIPAGETDVMLQFLDIQRRLGKAPEELEAAYKTAEAEGWAGDEERVLDAVRESADRVGKAQADMRALALDLLRQANDDVPDLRLPVRHCAAIIQMSLRSDGDLVDDSAEAIAARALGLEPTELAPVMDAGDDADPPTGGKTGRATATVPRSRSATRSRKRSSR